MLDEIHRQRDLARQAREEADQAQREAEAIRNDLADRLDKIEDERYDVMEAAREDAEKDLAGLREEMEALRRQLAQARQPLEALDDVEDVVEALEEEVAEPVIRKTPAKPVRKVAKGPLRLGEKVHLRSIDQDGVVTAIGEDEVEVQIGMLRIRARRADVVRKGDPEPEAKPKPAKPKAGKVILPSMTDSPGVELDIRGQRVDEGLDALDHYLERAYLVGLPFVRIIHGKGTGRLRDSVRQALQDSPHVSRFESGGRTEGGEGVTVAHLKTT